MRYFLLCLLLGVWACEKKGSEGPPESVEASNDDDEVSDEAEAPTRKPIIDQANEDLRDLKRDLNATTEERPGHLDEKIGQP